MDRIVAAEVFVRIAERGSMTARRRGARHVARHGHALSCTDGAVGRRPAAASHDPAAQPHRGRRGNAGALPPHARGRGRDGERRQRLRGRTARPAAGRLRPVAGPGCARLGGGRLPAPPSPGGDRPAHRRPAGEPGRGTHRPRDPDHQRSRPEPDRPAAGPLRLGGLRLAGLPRGPRRAGQRAGARRAQLPDLFLLRQEPVAVRAGRASASRCRSAAT